MSKGTKVFLFILIFLVSIAVLTGVVMVMPTLTTKNNNTDTVDAATDIDEPLTLFLSIMEGSCTIWRDGQEILVSSRFQLKDGDVISTGEETSVWITNKSRKNFLLAENTTVKIEIDYEGQDQQGQIFLLKGACFYDFESEKLNLSTFGISVLRVKSGNNRRSLGFLYTPDFSEQTSNSTYLISAVDSVNVVVEGAEKQPVILNQQTMLTRTFSEQERGQIKQIIPTSHETLPVLYTNDGSVSILDVNTWSSENFPSALVDAFGNVEYINALLQQFNTSIIWSKYAFSTYTLYIDDKEVCYFTNIKKPNINFASYLKDKHTLLLTTEKNGEGICYFKEEHNRSGVFFWNSETNVVFTSDVYLYTHYIQNKFTILFDSNGGICDIKNFEVASGASYGKLPTPTREGYSFLGWYTDKQGSKQVYESDSTSESTTLYALWERSEFNVTLDWQTDRGFKDVFTVKAGKTLNQQVDVPVGTQGYDFRGFFTETNGDGEMYYDENGHITESAQTTSVKSDISLYAHWTKVQKEEADVDINTDLQSGNANSLNQQNTSTNSSQSSSTENQNTSTNTSDSVATQYTYCKPTDYVNVRTGPGMTYDKITTLPPGTELRVLNVLESGWTHVKSLDGSITGYMSTQYLSFYNKTTAEPTFTVSLSKTVVKIARYQTIYIKAIPSVDATVYWESENRTIATVIEGMIYGVSVGNAVINVKDKDGNILASVHVSVEVPEAVRFAYASENIAAVGEEFFLKAITDDTKNAVKFVVSVDGTEKEFIVNQCQTQSTAGNGVVNTVKIWSQKISFDKPGTFSVKVYSQTESGFSVICKEFSCFIVSSVDSNTTTEVRRASTAIINYISQFEGFVSVVTPDALAYNIPTVGYGYVVNPNVIYYNNLTQEEGLAQLINTINNGSYASALNTFIVKHNIKMNQAQFDSLVSFNYNLGSSYWNREGYVFDLKNMILNAVIVPEGYFSENRIGVITKAAGCSIYVDVDRTSTVIGTLLYGDSIKVIGYSYDMDTKRGWYTVKTNSGAIGYVHCGYISLNDSVLEIDCNYIDSFAFGTEIIRWHHAGGKCYAGLLYRRLAEGKVFCFGKYEDFSKSAATYKYNLYDFSYPTCMPSYDYKYPNYKFEGGVNVISK